VKNSVKSFREEKLPGRRKQAMKNAKIVLNRIELNVCLIYFIDGLN
jgi:hypothetical protein